MVEEEQSIQEQLEGVTIELMNPDLSEYQKRCLLDESIRLNSKMIIERQLANEPKPYFLKEMRK